MKNFCRRFLSLALAIIITAGSITTSAFATEGAGTDFNNASQTNGNNSVSAMSNSVSNKGSLPSQSEQKPASSVPNNSPASSSLPPQSGSNSSASSSLPPQSGSDSSASSSLPPQSGSDSSASSSLPPQSGSDSSASSSLPPQSGSNSSASSSLPPQSGEATSDSTSNSDSESNALPPNNSKYDITNNAAQGWITENGHTYYKNSNGNILTGLQLIEGSLYIFAEDGKLQTGHVNYKGDWYYTDGAGVVFGNHMLNRDDGLYTFYDCMGTAKLGWNENVITKDRYYQILDNNRGLIRILTGSQILQGKYYLFSEKGVLQTGWLTQQGETYYYDKETGSRVFGVTIIEGKMYIFAPDGKLQKGHVNYKGDWYYTDGAGAVFGNYMLNRDDGLYTFYDFMGTAKLGWNENVITKDRYYQILDNNRGLIRILTGPQILQGKYYLFSEKGVLQTGWLTQQGETYYYDKETGSRVSGVTIIEGKMYIFAPDGKLQKGHVNYKGDWYYTDGAGAVFGNYMLNRDDGLYTFYDCMGTAKLGWNENVITKDRYYQISDSGRSMIRLVTGSQIINGIYYMFNDKGVLDTGWVKIQEGTFYLDAETGTYATGVKIIEGKMYVFANSGMLQKGHIFYNGEWYYANASGEILGNFMMSRGNGLYTFYDCMGTAKLGWNQNVVTKDKYYQIYDPIREMIRIVTGIYSVQGEIYYFEQSGKLFTPAQNGYYTIEGASYYVLTDGRICQKPVIKDVKVEYNDVTRVYHITVDAKFNPLGVNPAGSYSFNGGVSWQTGNSIYVNATANGKIPAGTIQVRDNLPTPLTDKWNKDISIIERIIATIDVSAFQGIIDWKAVADSGVKNAVIRALTWSRATNGYIIDPYFVQNVCNAKAYGIKVGAYLYSYAFNEAEIIQEVDFFATSDEVKKLREDNIKFDMPIFIDYEDPLVIKNTDSNELRTNIVRTGMKRLNYHGYSTGFYTYDYFARNYMSAQQLINEGFDFWIANFGESGGHTFPNQVVMWQYSSTGSVPGIVGNVDMNYLYIDYASAGGNVPKPVSSTLTVYDVNTGSIITAPVRDILAQIVYNEVGYGLSLTGIDRNKLYSAQAVAANSWIRAQYASGQNVPKVGLKVPPSNIADEIFKSVDDVLHLILLYNGQPVLAAYGSASADKTNSARNMGWSDQPYLVSVASDKENAFGGAWQNKTVRISLTTMKKNIEKILGVGATKNYDTTQWLQNPTFDANGYLLNITVCGQSIDGGKFYENCYGLLSPNFTIQNNGNNGEWVFTTNGNGHCVGMSQYGAAGYIAYGWSWQQVLLHYFPGTVLNTVP